MEAVNYGVDGFVFGGSSQDVMLRGWRKIFFEVFNIDTRTAPLLQVSPSSPIHLTTAFSSRRETDELGSTPSGSVGKCLF